MRDIKFRAWDKATNEMLFEWDTQGWGHDLLNPFDDANFTRMEIMQYTGLKDKNEKEIYEGDIVRVDGRVGFIKFNHGSFVIRLMDITNWKHLGNRNDKTEVIGNVHENPELLK